jgi:hypothetical protein
MTLLELASELDPFERSHVNSIWMETNHKGYKVEFRLSLYRPDDPYYPADESSASVDRLPGLECESIVKAPDIERIATWEIPIWDQITQLVHDPGMSEAVNLGTMIATEESRVIDGNVADNEAQQFWRISTHGRPRSPERLQWMERTAHTV